MLQLPRSHDPRSHARPDDPDVNESPKKRARAVQPPWLREDSEIQTHQNDLDSQMPLMPQNNGAASSTDDVNMDNNKDESSDVQETYYYDEGEWDPRFMYLDEQDTWHWTPEWGWWSWKTGAWHEG